jgi:hypothetical protein
MHSTYQCTIKTCQSGYIQYFRSGRSDCIVHPMCLQSMRGTLRIGTPNHYVMRAHKGRGHGSIFSPVFFLTLRLHVQALPPFRE